MCKLFSGIKILDISSCKRSSYAFFTTLNSLMISPNKTNKQLMVKEMVANAAIIYNVEWPSSPDKPSIICYKIV